MRLIGKALVGLMLLGVIQSFIIMANERGGGSYLVFGIIALVLGFLVVGSYRKANDSFVRKSEGTDGISNDKFVERILDRAEDILNDKMPDGDFSFKLADVQTRGAKDELQAFFYKLSDPDIDQQEDHAGKSYGFSFLMSKSANSSCVIEKVMGMNDQMKALAKKSTSSVEQGAEFVAQHSISVSKNAAQRSKKLSRAA